MQQIDRWNKFIIAAQKEFWGADDAQKEISAEALYEYIQKCTSKLIEIFNELRDHQGIEGDINNPFVFKNLKFNSKISWEKITESSRANRDNYDIGPKLGFNQVTFVKCHFLKFMVQGGSQFFTNKPITVNIEDCLIEKLDISPNRHVPQVISKIRIEHGKIDDLIFHGQKDSVFSHLEFLNRTQIRKKLDCLQSCVFSQIKFENIEFAKMENSRISFNNSKFENTTQFINCSFYSSPKFHNSQIHSDTTFEKCEFLDVKSNGCSDDYRVLKQEMHKIGDEITSMMFHACEMDARRKTKFSKWKRIIHPKDWVAWFPSWFLKTFNDYGRNFMRPWLWFFLLGPFFISIYKMLGGVSCNMTDFQSFDPWIQSICTQNKMFAIHLLFTVQHIFGPVGLFLNQNVLQSVTGWVHALSLVQAFIYTIFWYLIIVQIRRQFRL